MQQEDKINAEFDEYKKNPDASDAESEDEPPAKEDSDSEESMSSSEDEVVQPKAVKKKDWSGSEMDSSDQWSTSSDESDSSSDFDSDEGTGGEGEFARYTIAYFLKKPEGPKRKTEKAKRKPKTQRPKTVKSPVDDDDWEKVPESSKTEKFKDGKIQIFAKGNNYTVIMLY